jgi:hypothetical protein
MARQVRENRDGAAVHQPTIKRYVGQMMFEGFGLIHARGFVQIARMLFGGNGDGQ